MYLWISYCDKTRIDWPKWNPDCSPYYKKILRATAAGEKQVQIWRFKFIYSLKQYKDGTWPTKHINITKKIIKIKNK